MCHKIYTFSRCYHIDISDDEDRFPPCFCKRIRGTRYLARGCNACTRYASTSLVLEHKRAIERQIYRFRSLKLTRQELTKHVPGWKQIVGLGVKIGKHWPDENSRGIVFDDLLDEGILDAIDDEVVAAVDPADEDKVLDITGKNAKMGFDGLAADGNLVDSKKPPNAKSAIVALSNISLMGAGHILIKDPYVSIPATDESEKIV